MSKLVINNLWKEYGTQIVLERVNLEVADGEFCTIVGASGCGKTTFLRMLLGQEQPTRGDLLLDGEAIPNEPGPDRGVVFQRYSVFPHLTALQNVMMGLELHRAPITGRLWGGKRRQAQEQALAALDAVGLHGARDKYPSALSGGMQQRLAIAQSLVKEPKILLLDEPFGALDPGIRHDMHDLVRELWERNRMTIFMITHDIQEAFDLGTRVLTFDKVRHDPQQPERYGATITYNLPLERKDKSAMAELQAKLALSA